jgi:dihydrofolate synthase/folylpolyglutamate synthase
MPGDWTVADAERYVGSLEPIGWRFGLDRMRLLTSALGLPQNRFASIHVVGTNGKSSTASMSAAVVEAHGVSAGAYLSPHIESWTERVQIGGRPIDGAAFAAAVQRADEAAAVVNRSLDADDLVTQFELLTAAAFIAFAAAGVEVVAIEAGLGGRLDATNVIPSRVAALTSIGLEHTQWLGASESEIATEKLAVLRDRSTLVLGQVSPEVAALAQAAAAERHARLIGAAEPSPELAALVRGAFQRQNLAVALAAAEAAIGPLEAERNNAAISELELPGRLELVPGEPPLVLDRAHNPAGAAALAVALPELIGERPVAACLAVLEDKDAPGIAAALSGVLAHVECTEIPAAALQGAGRGGARSLPAARLADACRTAGIGSVEQTVDPAVAVTRALAAARDRGGVALCTGSHYLSPYAWTVRRAQS